MNFPFSTVLPGSFPIWFQRFMLRPSERITIFLAESQYLRRLGLRSVIGRERGLEIVGESSDPVGVMSTVCQARPDVVLMDLSEGGLIVAQHIVQNLSATRILSMATDFTPVEFNSLLDVGVTGFCRREVVADRLRLAIRSVHAGDIYIDGRLSCRMRACHETSIPIVEGILDLLTPREAQILLLITCGTTNKQIAETLFVSVSTVKVMIRHILNKLQVEDRTQAAVLATRNGLVAADVQAVANLSQ